MAVWYFSLIWDQKIDLIFITSLFIILYDFYISPGFWTSEPNWTERSKNRDICELVHLNYSLRNSTSLLSRRNQFLVRPVIVKSSHTDGHTSRSYYLLWRKLYWVPISLLWSLVIETDLDVLYWLTVVKGIIREGFTAFVLWICVYHLLKIVTSFHKQTLFMISCVVMLFESFNQHCRLA